MLKQPIKDLISYKNFDIHYLSLMGRKKFPLKRAIIARPLRCFFTPPLVRITQSSPVWKTIQVGGAG
jgi:hypothetical protein